MLVSLGEVTGWVAGLDDVMALIAHRFRRVEPRRRVRGYLLGLLSPLAGKRSWTIAEAAGDDTPDGMQRLLNDYRWDAEAVRDDLRGYVAEHLSAPDGVLIVDETGAGFSAAKDLVRPLISAGRYGYEQVNVTAQRGDPASLLAWFERMIRTLRESPEVGAGRCTPIDKGFAPGVLAHRADHHSGSMLFLHNLSDEPATVDLGELDADADHPNQVLGDQPYGGTVDLSDLSIDGYGYRWIRLCRNPG